MHSGGPAPAEFLVARYTVRACILSVFLLRFQREEHALCEVHVSCVFSSRIEALKIRWQELKTTVLDRDRSSLRVVARKFTQLTARFVREAYPDPAHDGVDDFANLCACLANSRSQDTRHSFTFVECARAEPRLQPNDHVAIPETF